MRVVFMGTPGLAASIVERLAGEHEVVAVFTRPDAVRGRGRKLVPSPVKAVAIERGIPVHEATSLAGDGPCELVSSLRPDVICVVACGIILPKSILDIPVHGCLNVHTSLLPRWRGAAPIERALLAHDAQTGVCVMRMEEGLDTGPYCLRQAVDIDGLYLEELEARLAEAGGSLLLQALGQVQAGSVEWTAQPDAGITYAEKIGKGELDFGPEDTVADIDARVRASSASHPARTAVDGRGLQVERVEAVPEGSALDASDLAAGQAAVVAKRLVVAASDGLVELTRVRPDGKKSMEGRAFAAGLQKPKGARMTWGK